MAAAIINKPRVLKRDRKLGHEPVVVVNSTGQKMLAAFGDSVCLDLLEQIIYRAITGSQEIDHFLQPLLVKMGTGQPEQVVVDVLGLDRVGKGLAKNVEDLNPRMNTQGMTL